MALLTVNLSIYSSHGTMSVYFKCRPNSSYSILFDIKKDLTCDINLEKLCKVKLGVTAEPSDFEDDDIERKFIQVSYDLAPEQTIQYIGEGKISPIFSITQNEAMTIAKRLIQNKKN